MSFLCPFEIALQIVLLNPTLAKMSETWLSQATISSPYLFYCSITVATASAECAVWTDDDNGVVSVSSFLMITAHYKYRNRGRASLISCMPHYLRLFVYVRAHRVNINTQTKWTECLLQTIFKIYHNFALFALYKNGASIMSCQTHHHLHRRMLSIASHLKSEKLIITMMMPIKQYIIKKIMSWWSHTDDDTGHCCLCCYFAKKIK